MNVPLTEAKAKLTDLVRRAEAGDDIVLTRHGQPAVRLVPVARKPTYEEKWAALERVRGVAKDAPCCECVKAGDADKFLYDENGLPA